MKWLEDKYRDILAGWREAHYYRTSVTFSSPVRVPCPGCRRWGCPKAARCQAEKGAA